MMKRANDRLVNLTLNSICRGRPIISNLLIMFFSRFCRAINAIMLENVFIQKIKGFRTLLSK